MINVQIVDIDNPPRSLGKLTSEEKKKGLKALEESIKRSNKKNGR